MPGLVLAAPRVGAESVSHVTSSDAKLEATIATQPEEHVITQFQLATSSGGLSAEFQCPAQFVHSSLCLLLHGETPFPVEGVGPPGGTVSLDLAGIVTLSPGTTYDYRIIAAETLFPPGDVFVVDPPVVYGATQSFTTPSPPGVSTAAAFATGPTTAIVDGSAEPKGESTTVHADYALAGEPWCTSHGAEGSPAETAPQSIGSINGVVSEILVKLEGLTPRSEYCAELVAHNESGAAFGGQVRFTTPKKRRHRHSH